jgi:hypothetical protein
VNVSYPPGGGNPRELFCVWIAGMSIIRTPGATPIPYSRPPLSLSGPRGPIGAPAPPTMPATWVPWPVGGSSVSGFKETFSTLPARSGWVSSIPSSTTAIVTPLPSIPRPVRNAW